MSLVMATDISCAANETCRCCWCPEFPLTLPLLIVDTATHLRSTGFKCADTIRRSTPLASRLSALSRPVQPRHSASIISSYYPDRFCEVVAGNGAAEVNSGA